MRRSVIEKLHIVKTQHMGLAMGHTGCGSIGDGIGAHAEPRRSWTTILSRSALSACHMRSDASLHPGIPVRCYRHLPTDSSHVHPFPTPRQCTWWLRPCCWVRSDHALSDSAHMLEQEQPCKLVHGSWPRNVPRAWMYASNTLVRSALGTLSMICSNTLTKPMAKT